MTKKILFACALSALMLGLSPVPAAALDASAPMQNSGSAMSEAGEVTNPFFAEGKWETPFGAPPFDKIKEEHYGPAFDAAMVRHDRDIQKITSVRSAATFVNTIEALERSGEMLNRVANVFFNLTGAASTEGIRAVQSEYAPKLSLHEDEIYLNPELWARVKSVYENRASFNLDPQQLKLLEDYRRGFIRAGADLNDADKERLKTLNSRLAELYTEFGNRLRAEAENYALVIDDEADLAGLPPEVRESAAATAAARGMEGKWAFTIVRSSITPFLQFADNRDLREEIYQAYISAGANGNESDTREILKEIARLRAEKARLLGFETFADYALDNRMAKTPAAVYELLNQIWEGAIARAKRERDKLEAMLKADVGPDAKLRQSDWWYYTEKVRKADYDLSEDELKPYFPVDQVREGAFSVASRLFGITFNEVTDQVPRYHPDVKAFDVRTTDGQHVGLLYVDYFARDGKRGGAWASAYRSQSKLDGEVRPIIVNVGNFPSPAGGKPGLLGWDEVETLFHEFGHALHGLLSDVKYESQSGTSVKRDYVEFPSQLLEHWASEPSVMKTYARHYQTGAPIPDALIAKINATEKFNQGFDMTELAAASLLDMKWHTMNLEQASQVTDVKAFDTAAMDEIGLIDEIAPRYYSPYFQHIFSGDGYSAGYYVYLWAQVLEADAWRAFQEAGSAFDPALAGRMKKYIFSAGGSDEEMKLYEEFRGRQPEVQALLEQRGLVEAGQ